MQEIIDILDDLVQIVQSEIKGQVPEGGRPANFFLDSVARLDPGRVILRSGQTAELLNGQDVKQNDVVLVIRTDKAHFFVFKRPMMYGNAITTPETVKKRSGDIINVRPGWAPIYDTAIFVTGGKYGIINTFTQESVATNIHIMYGSETLDGLRAAPSIALTNYSPVYRQYRAQFQEDADRSYIIFGRTNSGTLPNGEAAQPSTSDSALNKYQVNHDFTLSRIVEWLQHFKDGSETPWVNYDDRSDFITHTNYYSSVDFGGSKFFIFQGNHIYGEDWKIEIFGGFSQDTNLPSNVTLLLPQINPLGFLDPGWYRPNLIAVGGKLHIILNRLVMGSNTLRLTSSSSGTGFPEPVELIKSPTLLAHFNHLYPIHFFTDRLTGDPYGLWYGANVPNELVKEGLGGAGLFAVPWDISFPNNPI